MSAESDPLNDRLHPLALNARIGALEEATYLALACVFRDVPDALDRLENMAARVNGPDEQDDTRKAFERMVKAISRYQRTIRAIEEDGDN